LIGNMHDEATFFERDNPAFFHMGEAAVTKLAKERLGDAVAQDALALYRKELPNATPVERAIAIETALIFGIDTGTLADRKALQPAPVFRYINEYRSNVPIKGTDWTLRAGHASDIATVFYNYEMSDLQGQGPGLAAASKAVSSYFTSFARDAKPVAAEQPDWPHYDPDKRMVMLLNSTCRAARDPNAQAYKFWTALGWG
jgi:para-nitrobenzyl esterase